MWLHVLHINFSCLILNFINTLLATCLNFHLFSKGLCGSSNEIFPISLRYLDTWSPAGGSLGRGSGGVVEGLRCVTLPKKVCHQGWALSFRRLEPFQVALSASYLWMRMWALSCCSRNACLPACLPAMLLTKVVIDSSCNYPNKPIFFKLSWSWCFIIAIEE